MVRTHNTSQIESIKNTCADQEHPRQFMKWLNTKHKIDDLRP